MNSGSRMFPALLFEGDHDAETPGLAVLGAVREPFVRVAGSTQPSDLDVADARRA